MTRFEGQVKCIYIDIPYNTGNDSFGYNDKFNHSTWLTFMSNRLCLARKLLKKEGTIAISVDNYEIGYLTNLLKSTSKSASAFNKRKSLVSLSFILNKAPAFPNGSFSK
mgnify:CR=1 FL=1